ncbi:hypothetical protein AB5I39_14110 [Sphingomonas sp. MMS24-J45]|uniref:hypothetical protein n=1 Tax=Sphingomonas sp. MMS24-J45 TaxID=3238806 RepID=UPI00384FC3DE
MTTLAGMTVNERLAATGRTGEWEDAVRAGDRAAMIRTLRRVAIPNADRVADAVLADPAFYGFDPA